MIVIDNALPKTVFNEMVKIVTDWENFPYYFNPYTAYNDGLNKMNFSYAHMFVAEGRSTSILSNYFLAAVHSCIDLTENKLDYVDRIRLGMILSNNNSLKNEAHVDNALPHKTGLLYLNDSDGDTIFYDTKYDPRSDLIPSEYGRKQEMREVQRITPKANKLVIFDGLTYHASSKPVNSPYRLVLNFNFIEKL